MALTYTRFVLDGYVHSSLFLTLYKSVNTTAQGPTDYPIVVGHEIVGIAVRVGSQAVGDIKVGDVVGVGGQADACLNRDSHSCSECANGTTNYCPNLVQTYGSNHRNGDKAYGGYALYHRATSHFVFKMPDGLKPEFAAPMLCAGATVFAPLKEYNVKKGMKVGVVGVGGLGHFAILFAKALGAEVVGISRTNSKKEDTLTLGADAFAATASPDWHTPHIGTLDLIINTSSSEKSPLFEFLLMLKTHGTLVQIGAPEAPVPVPTYLLAYGHKKIAGSLVGSPAEIREMLQLAAEKRVEPMVDLRPMSEANQAVVDMEAGKARYRYVLVN